MFKTTLGSPGDKNMGCFHQQRLLTCKKLSQAGVSQALPTLGLPFLPAVGRELCHPLVSPLFKQNVSVYLLERTFVGGCVSRGKTTPRASAAPLPVQGPHFEVFIDTAGRRNLPILRRILQKFHSVQGLGKPLQLLLQWGSVQSREILLLAQEVPSQLPHLLRFLPNPHPSSLTGV